MLINLKFMSSYRCSKIVGEDSIVMYSFMNSWKLDVYMYVQPTLCIIEL